MVNSVWLGYGPGEAGTIVKPKKCKLYWSTTDLSNSRSADDFTKPQSDHLTLIIKCFLQIINFFKPIHDLFEITKQTEKKSPQKCKSNYERYLNYAIL